MSFRDRQQAGARLAERLASLRLEAPLVVALPRGGVVVATEVARGQSAPLDILPVRKVGAPLQPEYAIGAVAPGGVRVYDRDAVRLVGISPGELEMRTLEAETELRRRERPYRRGRPPLGARDRDVVLVDDGIATGLTVRAHGSREARATPDHPRDPVAAAATVGEMRGMVDELACLSAPYDFLAVGAAYEEFPPATDEQVVRLLAEAGAPKTVGAS